MTIVLLAIFVLVAAGLMSLAARRTADPQKRLAMLAASGLLVLGALAALAIHLTRIYL